MSDQANKFRNPYGSGPQFFDPRTNGPFLVQGGDSLPRAQYISAPVPRPVSEPSYGQKIVKKIAPYMRPVLETGGGLAGGFIGGGLGLGGGAITGPGAIATSAAGGLLGAGLGHAWGRSVANALEQYAGIRQAPTLIEAARDTGIDILNGAADHAFGRIVSPALEPAAKGLASRAPWFNKQATKVFPDLHDNPVVDVASGYAKDKAQAAFEKYQEERLREAARRRAREAGR